jgi:hypothetical protein
MPTTLIHAHVPKKVLAPTMPKLKCSVCGEQFPYTTIHDKDPARICGNEHCYAEKVREYWEKQGFRADVQLNKAGDARLISIQRAE